MLMLLMLSVKVHHQGLVAMHNFSFMLSPEYSYIHSPASEIRYMETRKLSSQGIWAM